MALTVDGKHKRIAGEAEGAGNVAGTV